MNRRYWLMKSEPSAYSWQKFVAQGEAVWDGVRNYQARNNLRAMRKGDWALFYHSNEGQCVVGIAEISKEFYADPTTTDARWLAVSLIPIEKFPQEVPLATIKAKKELATIALVKQSRLSVSPLDKKSFKIICKLGQSRSKI